MPARPSRRCRCPSEPRLERLGARAPRRASGPEPTRPATRSGRFLLVYLRDFASPDGLLPLDFDALVRESFGELVAGRMSPSVLQRTVALAAVALLAAVGALALDGATPRRRRRDRRPGRCRWPRAGWYDGARRARAGAPRDAERTTCRRILTARSLGVSHPVLPCGAKLFISYGGTEVLTEVIDTRLKRPGRQFELTEALAQRLGIEGTQQITLAFRDPGRALLDPALHSACSTLYVALRVNVNQRSREGSLGPV